MIQNQPIFDRSKLTQKTQPCRNPENAWFADVRSRGCKVQFWMQGDTDDPSATAIVVEVGTFAVIVQFSDRRKAIIFKHAIQYAVEVKA